MIYINTSPIVALVSNHKPIRNPAKFCLIHSTRHSSNLSHPKVYGIPVWIDMVRCTDMTPLFINIKLYWLSSRCMVHTSPLGIIITLSNTVVGYLRLRRSILVIGLWHFSHRVVRSLGSSAPTLS